MLTGRSTPYVHNWVPDHGHIFSKEKADANLGAELIPCPLETEKSELYIHFEQITQSK